MGMTECGLNLSAIVVDGTGGHALALRSIWWLFRHCFFDWFPEQGLTFQKFHRELIIRSVGQYFVI